ncbi:MAG: hypothetical protein D6757_01970 [Alphaproteobacteria bacterium]|nr:MAG: hypothetical protein D6757_01970 [Alphaproteobacteria bacterium]
MSSLLIFGTRRDPHVTRVEEAIGAHGVRTIVLDYLRLESVCFRLDGSGSGRLEIAGREVLGPFIIWDRLKLFQGSPLYPRGDAREADWCAMEWRALCRLLAGVYRDRLYNSLESRSCLLKPYQQMVAARVGLRVPETLVSNRKRPILAFVREQERAVIKSLSAGKVQPRPDENDIPYNVFTMPVSSPRVRLADADSFRRCPHFLQQQIAKDHELRIAVVGERLFAFRIESQKYAHSRVDWRYGVGDVGFEPVEVSPQLGERLLAFMREMGLFSGSFDIIVDPEGEYWFLECNQDGQWAWLDDLVNGAIAEAFADGFRREIARFATLEAAS